MERLIQLLDVVDDWTGPLRAFLTHVHWLRAAALTTFVIVLIRIGVPWPVTAVLAAPALPLSALLSAQLRRLAGSGFKNAVLLGVRVEL